MNRPFTFKAQMEHILHIRAKPLLTCLTKSAFFEKHLGSYLKGKGDRPNVRLCYVG